MVKPPDEIFLLILCVHGTLLKNRPPHPPERSERSRGVNGEAARKYEGLETSKFSIHIFFLFYWGNQGVVGFGRYDGEGGVGEREGEPLRALAVIRTRLKKKGSGSVPEVRGV